MPTEDDTTGENTTTETAPSTSTEDAGKAGTTSTPKIEGEFDKDRAERALAAARAGETKAKEAKRASEERLAKVLAAAGLTPDGKEDPTDQLKTAAEARDKAAGKYRDKSLRLSVREGADKAGVDPTAVLDSTTFRDSVAELDPDAADYDDQVARAMAKAVKANPRLAAAEKAATRIGAAHNGSGGTGSIDDQIAAAEKAGDVLAVIGLKRQKARAAKN